MVGIIIPEFTVLEDLLIRKVTLSMNEQKHENTEQKRSYKPQPEIKYQTIPQKSELYFNISCSR